jgi:gamma-glutamyl:cysteine ligase YbdK (ATP-grasp superfamily)
MHVGDRTPDRAARILATVLTELPQLSVLSAAKFCGGLYTKHQALKAHVVCRV